MKKIILILLASLMMMSGCTSEKLPKSDEEIQADCLKIQEIQSNLIELVSFKVNTRAFEGDYFVVKSTIELLTEKDDVKADVLMKYKKHTNTWFVDYSEINMISVISTEMPSESLILSVFNVDNDLPGRYEGSLFNKPTTLSLIDNPGNGTITYHFAQQEKNLIWTRSHEGTIVANYHLNKRWIPTLQEQTYSETMDWNGTYKMFFYTTPGTVAPDPIMITVTGSLTLDVTMDGHETSTSTLVGKFSFDGTDYVIDGEIDRDSDTYMKPSSRTIRFVYGSNGEALTMVVYFYTDPIDTYYEGTALGWNTSITKLD